MDIYIQNLLGFDVHAAIEAPEADELVIRLFPKRPTGKTRQTLFIRKVAKDDHERFRLSSATQASTVRWDFSALKTRVYVRRGRHEGDLLYELKIRNGHSG